MKNCRFNNSQIVTAYVASDFSYIATARKLGLTFQALYKLRKSRPELEAEMKAAKDEFINVAESKMIEAILAGDSAMIRFFLERKGGYRVQKEIAFSKVGINTAEILSALRRKHHPVEALDLSDL